MGLRVLRKIEAGSIMALLFLLSRKRPGVNQNCWLLDYPWQLEKNKDWSGGVLEWWKKIRTGGPGVKSMFDSC